MTKTYRGQEPDAAQGWQPLANIAAEDGPWSLYTRAQDHSPAWVTVKVVAGERVPGKANYWAAYNKSTRKVGYARDLMLMREYRPQLFEKVETILKLL